MQTQRRFLNLHEYQSLAVFQQYGVDVPKSRVVQNISEFEAAADAFDGDIVVKSQVLAGGRGLGYFKENNFQVF